MAPKELQQVLWKQFSADSTEWWDKSRSVPAPRHLDFRYNGFSLWLTNLHNPDWVKLEFAAIDRGLKAALVARATSALEPAPSTAPEGHVEVGICTKLCEDGLVVEAVDALDTLVQRGCFVPTNLFYRVLKGCIQHKNLGLGKRVHGLTVQSGYEGDAFLATHLIGLYASHDRLEEAREVFAKVSTPDAYNWAAIIFAYARHGETAEAAEAVRLYRQMCESTNIQPDDRLYVAILKACAAARDLAAGRDVHGRIATSAGGRPDRFVQAGLVNMYAKCGSLVDAREVFDQLPERNVVTWNTLIAGYAQHGMGQEAHSLYRTMQQEGLAPNPVTYISLLQACASLGVGGLDGGKQLHAQIRQRGYQEEKVLGGSLVNMYAKCGSLQDARVVFDKLSNKDVVTWTAIIAGYVQQGLCQDALNLFRRMQEEGLTAPNAVTYVCLLQACATVGVGAFDEGKQLHAEINERGLQADVVLGGSLVNMYVKCGSLEDARSLFDKLPDRNVEAWNAMIGGYAQQGICQEALRLYRTMQQYDDFPSPDCVTYVCLLQACASVGTGALHDGQQLHADITQRRMQEVGVLGGSLVNMYVKCGSLDNARRLFEQLWQRDILAWNSMIAGLSQQGMLLEALRLYRSMQQEGFTPTPVTYVCLLQACASVGAEAIDAGKDLHFQICQGGLQEDVILGGSLVNMYAKCGSLTEARIIFDKLLKRDVVTWTAMIAGYTQQGMGEEALSLYRSMQLEGLDPPNSVTYLCLLQACASVGVEALDEGKQLEAQISQRGLQEDVVLGGSLVNMHAKCGNLVVARSLFEKLPERNLVAWNAMISGYAQQGMGEDAQSLYSRMQQEGVAPDAVTYVSLLQACAAVAALPIGEQLHAEIEQFGMQADSVLGAALVNVYAKCGSMFDSQRVFDSLTEKSIDAWGALVGGYARQGDTQVVFDLLDRMKHEGLHPDAIIFLSVLTACSHAGLVDKGRGYFEAMGTEYGINATVEHYTCMVDLLGRAGHLDEALQIAKAMPFPATDVLWRTLLGACQKWKNVEIGQQAFTGAISVDENDAAAYVLMSNIYASTQMWEAAKEMRAQRMKLGVCKMPGKSLWTDMGGAVHTFLVGD